MRDAGGDQGNAEDSGASVDGAEQMDAGHDAGDENDIGADAGDDSGTDAGALIDSGMDAADLDVGGDAGGDASVEDVGSADSGADAGSEPECVEESFTFEWTVTEDDPLKLFELKLENEVEYKTAEFEFEFTPTDWHGQCYNPVYNPPKLVPVNNYPLHVRRGTHWCRGGNILDSTIHSPPDGVIIASYYAEHVGSSCSGDEHFIKKASHNVELGKSYAVKVFFDNVARRLDYDIGAERFLGTTDPNARIVAHPNEAFFAALSHEKWLECYDAEGNHSASANCCYQPSVGWTYKNFRYRVCR
jgi:hypothetical protein